MIKAFRVLAAIAAIARLFSFSLLLPIPVAFAYEPWEHVLFGNVRIPASALVFAASFVLATIFWVPVRLVTRRVVDEELQDREAYAAVALGWLAVAGFGMVPFLLSGTFHSPVDAFFESMSGITTTGASALHVAPEAALPSILFWRALMQWIGGLGFVILLVALLAGLTQGGSALMQGESGGSHSRIRPKLRDTARALWKTYVAISGGMAVVLFLLMLRIHMPPRAALFDAVVHTFTTFSTGGFSSHAASIGYYDDVYIEGATILFMVLGATQFTLYLAAPRRILKAFLANPQWRFLLAVLAASTLLVTGILVYHGSQGMAALRAAAFAVTSTLTTTGFHTADFSLWAQPALIVLLIMMLTGGNAGSTSGGIKSGRFVLLAKAVHREVIKLLHPRAVAPVRMERRIVPEEVLNKTVVFFFSYLSIWVFSTILLTLFEPSMSALEGAAATASALGDVGVGFGMLGPGSTYALLAPPTKILLSALMWVGRLEIFTVLLLFYPKTWKN